MGREKKKTQLTVLQTFYWTVILHTLSLSVSVVCAASLLSSSAILAASTEPSLTGTALEDWERPAESWFILVSVNNYVIYLAQHVTSAYLPRLHLFWAALVSLSSSGWFLPTGTGPDSSEPPAPATNKVNQHLQKYMQHTVYSLSENKKNALDWSYKVQSGDIPYFWYRQRLQNQQWVEPTNMCCLCIISQCTIHFCPKTNKNT